MIIKATKYAKHIADLLEYNTWLVSHIFATIFNDQFLRLYPSSKEQYIKYKDNLYYNGI